MSSDRLRSTEEFAGRLGLALIGGAGLLLTVLALMLVAYLSGPKRDHIGRPLGGGGSAAASSYALQP